MLDFLDVFNAVAKYSKGIPSQYIPATSLDDKISESTLKLDSLDITLTYAMLSDMYQIDQRLEDQWPTESVRALKEFIDENKVDDPTVRFDNIKDLMREYK